MRGAVILVTGATGFLGGAIARRLAAQGAIVRALARRPNRDRHLQGIPNLNVVMGDIMDTPRMMQLMLGCDYVIHAAAALGGSFADQYRVNVDGTRSVVHAASVTKVKRLVHISTIAAYGYGYTSGEVSEEDVREPGEVAYNFTKSQSEVALRQLAHQQGLSYSIVRPGMIYGAGSAMWTANMFRLARWKPTPFIGNGSGTCHPIHVEDVVSLAILVAKHPNAAGQAFHATPDPAPTWREFLGAYSALAGHQSWLSLPRGLAKLVISPADLLLNLADNPQELRRLIHFITGSATYKMTKARALLGWSPQVSLRDGIERCVPYLQARGLLKSQPT